MSSAKDIILKPIARSLADSVVKSHHYSGKTTSKTQLSMGVYLHGKIEGAIQMGPPIDKSKVLHLVSGTPWGGMVEINRMAFSEALPRNSESRAIAIAMRLLRRHAPHVQWVLSFADATQCGHGTIYQAAGFSLTGIRKNKTLLSTPSGRVFSNVGFRTSRALRLAVSSDLGLPVDTVRQCVSNGCRPLEGYQLRYIYFIDPSARQRLTVPILPFSAIDKAGARMYRGERVGSDTSDTSGVHPEKGGAIPTPTLDREA